MKHVMTIQARQAAHRLGHVAEWRAVWRLRLAGYSVLARRYKTKLGEIDIVVRRGGILAFVEVKARADFLTRDRRARQPPVRPRGRARPASTWRAIRTMPPIRCASTPCWWAGSGRAICPMSGGAPE